jgi:hypothetical protein
MCESSLVRPEIPFFLGAFRKTVVKSDFYSLCPSIHPFVRLEQRDSHLKNFRENLILLIVYANLLTPSNLG